MTTRPYTFTVMTTMLVVINLFALSWLPTLKTSDDYRLLLQTSDKTFQQYLYYQQTFTTGENDVLLILQGDVLAAESLKQLVALDTALKSLDTVMSVASLLDLPWVQRNFDGLLANDTVLHQELKSKLADPSYFPVKLLSDDGQTTVLSVGLFEDYVTSAKTLLPVVTQLREVVSANLSNSFSVKLAGFPVLRTELKQQAERDAIVFGGLSVLLSILVTWFFQRDIKVVAVSVLAPVSAVICSLALMAFLDIPINILNQMMIALVLVITYSDVLHVIRHLRYCREQGEQLTVAIRSTYKTVMVACFITSATTAAGFASLQLAGPAIIRQFGLICAAGIFIGFVVVVLSVPVIAGVIYGRQKALPQVSIRLPLLPERFDRPVIAGFIMLTLALLLVATQLRPDYQLGENLPTDNEVREAMRVADIELNGVIPFALMLQWQQPLSVRKKLSDIRRLQRVLETQTATEWMSVADLLRFSKGFNTATKVQMLPESARSRLFNEEASSALLVTQLPVMSAASLLAFQQQILAIADNTHAMVNPLVVVPVGFSTLTVNMSRQISIDLLKSLAGTFIIISALILVMFRSLRLGVLLIVPNIAPLASIAAILVFSGGTLQVATMVVFSICLGIVVDDSIHVLSRFQLYRKTGLDINEAVTAAVTQVGQVLVQTTVVICAGFSVLLFSNTPPVFMIGILCVGAIPVALLLDLGMLPALLRRHANHG